jgi:hypothetical protein
MLTLERLRITDIDEIAAAFAALGWNKPAAQYERYFDEQAAGDRVTIIARWDGVFVGYVNVLWQSGYIFLPKPASPRSRTSMSCPIGDGAESGRD